ANAIRVVRAPGIAPAGGGKIPGMAMDPAQKKVALRAINYGLYVLTARDGDDYGAGGVNWLSQASFEPPLVMAAVKADSGSAAIIGRTGTFAVSVLADDQLDI